MSFNLRGSWGRAFSGRRGGQTARPRQPQARLSLEVLEDRCLLAVPIVTYHGGPLLANVQVEAIFLGWNPVDMGTPLQQNEYNAIVQYGGNVPANGLLNPAAIPANPTGFFPTVLPSTYITSIGQYSVPGFNIAGGTYSGGVVADTPSTMVEGFGPTIYDSEIQATLQALVANAVVPAPNPNILYVVFTQPGMSVIWNTQIGFPSFPFYNASAPTTSKFGAYHFNTTAGGATASYTVEPSYLLNMDPVNSPRFLAYGDFATNTIVLGHEIGEAITDFAPILQVPINVYPRGVLPTGWFYRDGAGEIGDLAGSFPPIDFFAPDGTDYWVAQLWSNVILQSNAPHVLDPVVGLPPLPGQPLPSHAVGRVPYHRFTPMPATAPQPHPTNPRGVLGTPQSGTDLPLPVEPSLSVSPLNHLNLVLASQNGLQVSTDGGESWSQSFVFPIPSSGDSATAYDKQGRLYWANIDLNSHGIALSVRNSSTGAEAGGPYVVDTPLAGFTDIKEFLAADNPNGNPQNDSLFMTWTRVGPGTSSAIFVSRSADGGQTWSAPVQVSAAAEGYVWGSTVSVATNGEVFVAYHSQPGFTGTTQDGIVPDGVSGQTFVAGYSNSLGTQISKTAAFLPGQSDVTGNVQTGGRTITRMTMWTQGSWTPYVLADPSRPGHVYVIAANDPNPNVSGNVDHADIFLSTSADNGLTWNAATGGAPTLVEDAAHQPEMGITYSSQLFPTATIDSNGDILLSWYSNQRGQTNAQAQFDLDTYTAYSTDGGASFSAPIRLDANAFDPNAGTVVNAFNGPPATIAIGNSFGVALSDGSGYVAWNGNDPSATGQQVLFRSFSLQGSLLINGTAGNNTIRIVKLSPTSDTDEVFLNGSLIFSGSLTSISGAIQIIRGQDIDNTRGELPLPPVANVTVVLDYSNGDPVPTGGVDFEGSAIENNTIQVNADGNYTLGDTTLTVTTPSHTDTVMLSDVQRASLTGGPSDNTFTLNNWNGTTIIDGGGGNNTVVVAAGTVQTSQLTISNVSGVQVAGGTFNVDANFTVSSVQLQSAGTLAIQNQLTLMAAVLNSGVLNVLGAATIAGDYNQTGTGILNMRIGGTTAGTGYDQLNITGSAMLGGTLNVNLINGFSPSSGDVYEILTFASESGNFDTENFPSLSGGLAFHPDLESTFLNLDVF
jgi:hypothetical protein